MKNFDTDNPSKVKVEKKEISEEGKYTVDEALTLIGFGKVQLLMVITAGLCMLTIINETMGLDQYK